MARMPTLRTISNGTPADATDPEYNFTTIETHLDNEVINRDGSVAMQGPLVLSGPPVTDSQAATKGYVDSARFPGEIVEYGGDTAPLGWALCNGSPQSSTDPDFVALFAVIGYKYGDAGGGNFNLPDFRKRVAVGRDVAVPEYDTVGITGGSAAGVSAHSHEFDATHNHTSPSHNHSQNAHNHYALHYHTANPPNATTTSDTHSHGITNGAALLKAFGTEDLDRHDGGGAYTITADVFSHDTHSHSVNIGSFNTSGAYVSASNVSNNYTYERTAFNNATAATVSSKAIVKDTASTGEVGAGNYPPYVVVTKIVKL